MSDWTDEELDEFIDAFGLDAETATRADNGGLNFETNGYVPEGTDSES